MLFISSSSIVMLETLVRLRCYFLPYLHWFMSNVGTAVEAERRRKSLTQHQSFEEECPPLGQRQFLLLERQKCSTTVMKE